jgi:hypothetical protein
MNKTLAVDLESLRISDDRTRTKYALSDLVAYVSSVPKTTGADRKFFSQELLDSTWVYNCKESSLALTEIYQKISSFIPEGRGMRIEIIPEPPESLHGLAGRKLFFKGIRPQVPRYFSTHEESHSGKPLMLHSVPTDISKKEVWTLEEKDPEQILVRSPQFSRRSVPLEEVTIAPETAWISRDAILIKGIFLGKGSYNKVFGVKFLESSQGLNDIEVVLRKKTTLKRGVLEGGSAFCANFIQDLKKRIDRELSEDEKSRLNLPLLEIKSRGRKVVDQTLSIHQRFTLDCHQWFDQATTEQKLWSQLAFFWESAVKSLQIIHQTVDSRKVPYIHGDINVRNMAMFQSSEGMVVGLLDMDSVRPQDQLGNGTPGYIHGRFMYSSDQDLFAVTISLIELGVNQWLRLNGENVEIRPEKILSAIESPSQPGVERVKEFLVEARTKFSHYSQIQRFLEMK